MVCVSKNAYRWGYSTAFTISLTYSSALVAESFTGGTISFEESTAVNGTTWDSIEKLKNGEVSTIFEAMDVDRYSQGWPRSSAYVTKKYEELQDEYKEWPER